MGARTWRFRPRPRESRAADAERLLFEILDGIARENRGHFDGLAAGEDRGFDVLPRGDQGEYAAGLRKKWNGCSGELAKTEAPMSCPHGRPVVLRYSVREIERAFKRI